MSVDWSKVAVAAAAVLVSLGGEAAIDRGDVPQAKIEALEDRLDAMEAKQVADAKANCNRVDDDRDEIRATLLDIMPGGPPRAAAIARFPDLDCEAEVAGEEEAE